MLRPFLNCVPIFSYMQDMCEKNHRIKNGAQPHLQRLILGRFRPQSNAVLAFAQTDHLRHELNVNAGLTLRGRYLPPH